MKRGFTIVELLVVIVVIAILAAVTIVSYNGIARRATESNIKSDLRNTATKINITKVDLGTYPLTLGASDKIEGSNSTIDYQSDGVTFCLGVTTKTANGPSFFMTQTGEIQTGSCPVSQVVWTQVSAGGNHVLALASNGKVYAWGGNANGQLGIDSLVQKTTPTEITPGALVGKTITQVSAGENFSLALASDGTVYSWGSNTSGQLGVAGTSQDVPIAITGLSAKTITQVEAGGLHALARASDGTVYAWGANTYGQIGDTSTTARPTPVLVAGVVTGKTITRIATGYFHSMALGSTGVVYVWGLNTYGQIGDGSVTSPRATPVTVTLGCMAGKVLSNITAGNYSSIALVNDGTVCGWGYNIYGQLADGTTATPRSTSVVSGAISGKTISSIDANNMHVLAIASDGMLYVWGRNNYNQLGDGLTANRTSAFTISNASPLTGKVISQVSAGSNYSFALGNDGTLYSWGENTNGQLGNGTTTQQTTPLALPAPQ